MSFSADVDRRMDLMVHIKFWRHTCIPALLSGAELWTVTKSSIEKLERFQRWFLKKTFSFACRCLQFTAECNKWTSYHWLLIAPGKVIFSWQNQYLPKVSNIALDIFKLRLNMLNAESDSVAIGFLGDIIQLLET